MNYLVYQSYGSTDILNECCYSILSLLKHGFDLRQNKIVIYTDRKDYFSFLPSENLIFIELTNETIDEYKGPHAFVHRLKIKVLEDCTARFEGKILYADSDIYFLSKIDTLFNQIHDTNFVMCNNEGAISIKGNRIFEKFNKFITEHTEYLKSNNIPIPSTIDMWNAGIIGFQSPNKALIDAVLTTNDIIFEKFHSHVVEQLSFAYQLQINGTVTGASATVFHYWNLKEFRTVLAQFFKYHLGKSSIDEMIADVDSIRPDVLIKPKLAYESLSFIKKNLRKLKGKQNRWRFPDFTIGKTVRS
jgi:hypothetical protein